MISTHQRFILSLIVMFGAALNSLGALDSINFASLTVIPDDTEHTTAAEKLIEQTASILGRDYGNYLQITERQHPDYSASFTVYSDETQSVISIELTQNSSRKEKSTSLPLSLSYDTPRYLAGSLFFLWSSFHSYLEELVSEPPRYVDSLRTEYLSDTLVPEMNTPLIPMDLTVTSSGNFIAAFSLVTAEIDRQFRVVNQPGRSLYESGNYTSAGGVTATPEGTVFLKPSMGRYLYKVSRTDGTVSKVRAGIDLYGPFTALRDGSVIILDTQKKKAYRIAERKKRELELYTSPYSYIAALKTGPEGNIWIYDLAEKRIRIHSPEGEIIDSIVPVINTETGSSPVDFSVYDDGRFIVLYSTGTLAEFTREGIPIWRAEGYETPLGPESFPVAGKVTADSASGTIMIADTMGQRLIKFMEDYASTSPEDKIVELNSTGDDPAETAVKKALIYERLGSLETARQLWEDALEAGFNEEEAYTAMDRIEIEIIRASINRMKKKTLSVASKIGHESARQYYSRTIQLYEEILSLDPGRDDVREDKGKFENLFNQQGFQQKKEELLAVKNVTAEIFPALIQYYTGNPAGTVTLTNTGGRNIKIEEFSIFINGFMDFPSTRSKEIEILPGKTVTLDLYTIFNRSILDLEEDLPVNAKIAVTYKSGENQGKLEKTSTVLIHRRSAISWSDSGRLASFITPNDNNIEIFSHHAVSVRSEAEKKYSLLPVKFLQALRITEALSSYSITYVKDPDSPAESVIGFPEKTDTVRFPRRTLLIHSGDCDDSTSLLASLLESGGIETAVITSPGHVFLAFNTEEPKQNRWMFTTGNTSVIIHQGTVWIPLETTVLDGGFTKSWRAASKEYSTYSPLGKTEFLPLKELRKLYPPVPLKRSIYPVTVPSEKDIQTALSASFRLIEHELYTPILYSLKKDSGEATGRKKTLIKNRIGILHARFGNYKDAEKEFKACISTSPGFNSAYINLINLYKITKDTGNLTRIMEQIKLQNPELQVRLAEAAKKLEENNDPIVRASRGSEINTFIWESE